MKISKLLLFAASALVLGTACNDSEDEVTPQPAEDAIALAPTTASVPSVGGKAMTMVTSSGKWTLSGEDNEFVTPSALEGNDGDVVEFAVLANDQEEDRTFTYTFACGKKTAQFVITLKKMVPDAKVLELTYAPESNLLSHKGGEVKVYVASSDAWTLEGSHSFVHPSATSGENGAEVIFTVDPNDTDEEKTADYLFKMGDKEAAFQIVVAAQPAELLEITSKTEMRLAYTEEKRLGVTLKTDANYRDLTAEIVSETEGWLTYSIARPTEGGSEQDVTAYFAMEENKGETAREAAVTIKGVRNGAATLKIVQLPQSKIELEQVAYYAELEASTLAIPVTANVEFDVTVSEEGNGWLTFDNYTEGSLALTVEALGENPTRRCTVTLTEKNGPDNADPVAVSFTVTQKPRGLIEWVADMRDARCYFYKTVDVPTPISNMTNGTFEALVNLQEARPAGSLSTIMGIEGKFLLRLGDSSVPWNQIQMATVYKPSYWQSTNYNYTDTSLKLEELDRWYHIAVTWEGGNYKFYIDGEFKYEASGQAINPTLAMPYDGSYESDSARAFWLGYSYAAARFFPGYMSEVRVWNRALTEEEINAENHFYQVDPYSDGLVGYWKLNGEIGDNDEVYTIKDYSASGNDMVSETKIKSSNNTGLLSKLNYVEVSLP